MAPSRRDLPPQDLKLWRYVTRNVSAYRPSPDDASEEDSESTEERPARVGPRLSSTAVASPLPPVPAKALNIGQTEDMDRRQARRLKRGELPVDGRLDLHGLTLERAHAALTGFIRRAYAGGSRLVVVVTGKGAEGRGRIRAEAPHWLNAPDLRPLVLAVTYAHQHDGGGGALYVLLKRKR